MITLDATKPFHGTVALLLSGVLDKEKGHLFGQWVYLTD